MASADELPCRVIEGVLYTEGSIGVVTTEGPGRNPNTRDLINELYAVAQTDNQLQAAVFRTGDDLSRVAIGEGCGSTTMRMSDGRLSIPAAGAAECILQKQKFGLPSNSGELAIGQLDDLRLGMTWKRYDVPSVTIVRPDGYPEWEVRIHERAVAKMRDETTKWPNAETGGILVGRISELARVINVVDTLDAPDDSSRSPAEFILGKKDVRRRLKEYAESTNFTLYCLGTWHSHLQPGGPSALDRKTAKAVALARLAPSVLIIRAPDRLHAVIADKVQE